MTENFDVLVIGAGPGGYIAAIRATQLGFKTACVDNFVGKSGKPTLGGTCLNVGCIPSKALLQSSENYHALTHDFIDHGIKVEKASFDAKKMIERKDEIVTKLTGGIDFLFKKNKINRLYGTGVLKSHNEGKWQVEINLEKENTLVEATHVIIATGSIPRPLPLIDIDNKNILDNQGALNLENVPKRLGIIGSGVIGLEMGSVWSRLGAEVTILEAMPTFLAAADQRVAKEAQKIFKKDSGLDIQLKVDIKEIKNGKTVKIKYNQNDVAQTLEVDKLIVAIGRIPNTNGLGAKDVGLSVDDRGFIIVDDECKTNLPNLWAIGDVVRGPMLAHRASEEGVAVAERIAGQKPHVNFNHIPWIIYTNPEIAWVGKTEEQLKEEGVAYKKGASNFAANGRALGMGQSFGSVKILSCEKTDRILGVHIIGPMASELISEAVMALEFKASSEDIACIVHAHPTLSEVTHEAALAVNNRTLHG